MVPIMYISILRNENQKEDKRISGYSSWCRNVFATSSIDTMKYNFYPCISGNFFEVALIVMSN